MTDVQQRPTMLPTALPGCEVRWEPLAQLVPALAAADETADQLGARYPRALREEGRALAAAAFPAEAVAELAAEVGRLGLNRVVSAAITRDLPPAPGDEAAALVARIAAVADLGAVPAPEPGAAERLAALHAASGFAAAGLWPDAAPDAPLVLLHPVRLLPPAPAGKLFARNTPAHDALRMAFGDTGHVGADATLDWAQWYRLGVWHATLNRLWGRAVGAAATPELEAAFAALPEAHRRKAGVHEAAVHEFTSWAGYFLDGLVAAAKIVLERAVNGPGAGAEQQRWLRALGRVHIDWFVERVGRTAPGADGGVPDPATSAVPAVPDVAALDVTALAAEWLADAAELAAAPVEFTGPLAACESPLWSDALQVYFSPSVPRAARRSLGLWLRGQWPGETTTATPEELPAAPDAPRLVFALAEDADWLAALAADVAPEQQDVWRQSAAAGLLYAYRHRGTPLVWSRVAVAADADGLARLQQARRAFSDWTALPPAGSDAPPRSGLLGYDADGLLRLTGPDA